MALLTINMKSAELGCPTTVRILLPDYSEAMKKGMNGKMKVLWLLHGATNGPDDWLLETNLARYVKNRNLMVVLPSALNSDYSNYSVFANGFNFQDFFLDELMPMVYSWFPASSKREDNYIAGYSMGGTGAMQFGFIHPELFNGIGIFSSAPRDVDALRSVRSMKSPEWRIEGKDGTRFPGVYPPCYNDKEINMIAKYPTVGDFLDSPENTWDRFIDAVKGGNLPRILVSVGSEDRCLKRVERFRLLAEEIGAENITFDVIEGYAHEIACWDEAIQRFLDFFQL